MKFTCYTCGARLEADEDMRGERVPCPTCGGTVTIPPRMATQEPALETASTSSGAGPTSEEMIYQQIADELASDNRNAALWVKSIAKADGDEGHAKALYIKERFRQINKNVKNPAEMSDEWVEKYRGVKGWLLLFAIGSMLLQPLMYLSSTYTGLHDIRPLASVFTGLHRAIVWTAWINGVVVAYGIFVGWKIISGDQWADATARQYLVASLIAGIVSGFIFLFISDEPHTAQSSPSITAWSIWIRSALFFGVWYTYFLKSKRVKATFSGK